MPATAEGVRYPTADMADDVPLYLQQLAEDIAKIIPRVFRPEAFGALGGGADDTVAVNACFAAVQAAEGGMVWLSQLYTCLGAVVVPNDGAANPKQHPMLIEGPGGVWDGTWAENPYLGSRGGLDLRYDGTDGLHNAKFDTRGAGGLLEIRGVSLISGGADDYPIFQTTNTTVYVHHCGVVGNLGKTGQACEQDAFLLGGTTTVIGNGKNAAFQGYGSAIVDNYFAHIRRATFSRAYSNGSFIQRNTISLSCGAADDTAAAFHIKGYGGGDNSGNIVRDNLVENTGYPITVLLESAPYNVVDGHQTWDGPDDVVLAAIKCDAGSVGNTLIAAVNGHNKPFVIEAVEGDNTIISSAQNPHIQFATAITFAKAAAGPRFRGNVPMFFEWPGQADFQLRRVSAGQFRFDGDEANTTVKLVAQDLHIGAAANNYLQLGSLGTPDAVYCRAQGAAANITLRMGGQGLGNVELESHLCLNYAPALAAAAGGAAALPATPRGYFVVVDNAGVDCLVPFYPKP